MALAWSGGKDSSLALAALQNDPVFQPVALVTTITGDYDRISMHGVRRSVLDAQVKELALPLFEATIPPGASNAIYEEALMLALKMVRLQWPDVQHLAFGDLFLTDVRAYRERLLDRLGWTPLFPLWGRPTAALAREMVAAGVEAWLVCVDLKQLPKAFAGRRLDRSLLDALPPEADPCGEKGEFHTFVAAGPMLSRTIAVRPGETVERDGFAFADLMAS